MSRRRQELAGQVAIVTGGGRGLGADLARHLVGLGMAVAVAGREESVLEQTARRLRDGGGRTLAVPTDVTDVAGVEAVVTRATETLGPVDLLVNNAGLTQHGPLWESDPDEWWRVVEVNLRGPFLCSRAVIPGMIERGRGRIVNVSSGVGNAPSTDQTAYAASKAALTRLTDSLAGQVSSHGVGVFAVTPGMLRTDMGLEVARRRGGVRGDEWASPERVLDLVGRIAAGELDQLSGRFLRATDDVDELVRRSEEIKSSDLLQLRLRPLDEQ